MSLRRRRVAAAAALWPFAAAAQQRAALVDPLRLGIDPGLAALCAALVRAFGFDTGVAVKVTAAPAVRTLEALDRGELDVTLTDAPAAEERLVAAGLAHDHRRVAGVEFVLVGPAATKKQADPAGIAGQADIAVALAKVRDAGVPFVSVNDGSGAHLHELAMWRAAQIAPAAPWYRAVAPGTPLAAAAREAGAYLFVERSVWIAQGGAPLAILVDADPRLVAPVHSLRPFRSAHRAARLFTEWVTGARGRRVVGGVRGFRWPAG